MGCHNLEQGEGRGNRPETSKQTMLCSERLPEWEMRMLIPSGHYGVNGCYQLLFTERHPWAPFMFCGFCKQRYQPTAWIPVQPFKDLLYQTFYNYLEQRLGIFIVHCKSCQEP